MDYYVVLGIGEDADEETIRSAFRTLARRYHPDAGAGSSPVEFRRARDAYETLMDPERRRRYDRQLQASRNASIGVRQFRQVVVWTPFAEPLFGFSREPVDRPGAWGHRYASSLFNAIVEDFFASFDDDLFWRRHRW
jgi:curved DNA-binding protein CbpA